MTSTFRSLRIYNYRMWAVGALVSNIGSWMQRIAQDWIVLTQLTNENATAVGVVLALQFGPQVLLLPVTGFAADHLDRRKLLMATQAAMGLLALGLGLLTLSGHVQLWQVYAFALMLGCVTAFDSPARQTFVSDLVDGDHLSNAVGLNSTSFNLGRLVGPAVAGVLIAAVGPGWVFIINAVSFGAVLTSLLFLRVRDLYVTTRAVRTPASLVEGFRYVRRRPDLLAIMVMLFLVGTFGLNFPIFLSTMSVTVFDAGAGAFGLLMSAMAVGSVIGALLAAGRSRPRIPLLVIAASCFGTFLALAAVMPTYALFAAVLVVVGMSSQTLMTSSTTTIQMTTEPEMRGRVVAILLAVVLGGTPIGAPLVGWIADTFGPRWAIGVGAAAGIGAGLIGIYYLVKYQNLRIRSSSRRVSLTLDRRLEPAFYLETSTQPRSTP
ncbi:MAG: MFS transporter [bacterium]|nr:MFS transporter [bacterium]